MEAYFPLICVFVIALFLTGGLFYLYWDRYSGPNRIKKAISARKLPSQIRAELAGVNWFIAGLFSLIAGGILAYISWRYFGEWLANEAVETFKNRIATQFLRSFGNMPLDSAGQQFDVFIAVGASACLFLGVLTGAILGKYFGVRQAAKQFYLTEKLFKS